MIEKPTKAEVGIAVLKGSLGMIPVAGPLIAEIVGTTIPDKRLERLESMLTSLAEKVAALGADTLSQKLQGDDALGLLEDGMHLGARAVTEERRKRIAALVGNALTDGEAKYQESKRLLGILEELNDIELKILYAHTFRTEDLRNYYYAQHPEAAPPNPAGTSEESLRREAVYDAYLAHLSQLGLLDPQFKSPRLAGLSMTEIAQAAARPPEIVGHELSRLGNILLESVDLITRAG